MFLFHPVDVQERKRRGGGRESRGISTLRDKGEHSKDLREIVDHMASYVSE
jgi:hypothetical protein